MNLSEILQPSCVENPLQGKDKKSAITELVDLLDENGLLLDRDMTLEAVFLREQTRSTGIGSGVAIPHGKCKAVKELIMAVGISKEGIEFASIDSKPVKLIFLLVSPIDQTGPHIHALGRISRLMLDENFKPKLEQAQTPQQAYQLLVSHPV
jgi:fructose-specific phosphotransferase system IIA component